MSSANEALQAQQQRLNEFFRLLPLTLEIAGLPKSELGKPFTEGQLEVRILTIKTAYKLARQLVLEVMRG